MTNPLVTLTQHGYRITDPRRQILGILSALPHSPQELHRLLRAKGFTADLVTVYRTVELFTKLGITIKTQFGDNTARYERATKEGHHHHLICKQCGSVEDVPLNEKALLAQVQQKSRFAIYSHNLEFFGVCINCQ